MLAELVRLTTEDGLAHYGAIYPARGGVYPSKGGTRPAQDGNAAALGVVMVHGMTGSFIGEIESALPPMLAEAGFSTLVFNNRGHDLMGAATELFSGCIADIRAGLDLMEARGFSRLALFGHSKAGAKVAYYMAQTGDPRVAGLGVLSPVSSVHEIPTWLSGQFGKRDPQAWLKRVQALVERGKDDTFFSDRSWPYLISAATAAEHLATSGDDTRENLAGLRLPILAACGSLELDWCQVVANLLTDTPAGYRVELIEGGDHVYTGREQAMADLMVDWLRTL